MNIIIDANIIIAMLIKPGKPIDIFFKEWIELFAPSLLFEELENNKEIIAKKSYIGEEDIEKVLSILRERITIIPEKHFLKYKKHAEEICPCPKDITYFALALYLKCPMWTNEKKLQDQDIIRIYDTTELINMCSI